MKWAMAGAAMMLAASLTFGGNAFAADEHDHQPRHSEPPQISAPAAQPSQSESGKADGMLKSMESMPAHDHDACCKLSKSQAPASGHNHNH